MRPNRVQEALQALGGAGTTQDITRVVGGRPGAVSAQLSNLEKRGQVERSGTRPVQVRRWGALVTVTSTVWRLPC